MIEWNFDIDMRSAIISLSAKHSFQKAFFEIWFWCQLSTITNSSTILLIVQKSQNFFNDSKLILPKKLQRVSN